MPLFRLGYGLCDTSFKYGNLTIKPADSKANGAAFPAPLFQVSFDVTNTGAREGADVAEVYVAAHHSKVPRPAKELKGFARAELKPGATKSSAVTLDNRSFSYYDADAKQWHREPGEYQVLVRRSSQDIQLRGTVTLPAARPASTSTKQ